MEKFLGLLRLHSVCVRARRVNSSTSSNAIEAPIAESGNVVMESVQCKKGEDVRFGDLGLCGQLCHNDK